MGIITRMRKQTAVYWPFVSFDQFGHKTYGTAVQIKCRWEDKNEQFLDPKGQTQMSRSVVYVDRDMVPDDVLMLGVLADITDAVNILENAGAWNIRKYNKVPDIKAKEFLRTAFL